LKTFFFFNFVNHAAASSWLRRSWSPNYSVLVKWAKGPGLTRAPISGARSTTSTSVREREKKKKIERERKKTGVQTTAVVLGRFRD
jgi:hypothetical protein